MRHPAVAGQFYSGSESKLRKEIEDCFLSPLGPGSLPTISDGVRSILGAVIPHAGYIFSGPVAAHVYHAIASDGMPEAFVIIGPNHRGLGAPVAVTDEDFATPLGTCRVHREMARKIGGIVQMDRMAHVQEHSVEVQVPFIQYLFPKARIVPIVMGLQDEETARQLGKEIARLREEYDILVLASSDMSHYVPRAKAEADDRKVLDRIVALDVEGMYDTVRRKDVSMCGFGPVAAMIHAVDGRKGELLRYATSGDVMDMSDVVGYAAVIVKR
jgi:AmmeMemoRadiSam system protein B